MVIFQCLRVDPKQIRVTRTFETVFFRLSVCRLCYHINQEYAKRFAIIKLLYVFPKIKPTCLEICSVCFTATNIPNPSRNKNQRDALISQIYFRIELYMFRTVSLSTIRSLALCRQQYIQVMLITCMTITFCCVYSTRLLMMDNKPVRNMYNSIPK
jgi:hypothetical protein